MRRMIFLLMALPWMASCGGGSTPVTRPDIDPSSAAEAAIAQYDKNGDQALSAEEIEDSALSLQKWDADSSGSLSQSEIEERLQVYADSGTGMSGVSCTVVQGRRPLENAQVTFKPEEFLGGAILPASGTTGNDGVAVLTVADEFQPTSGERKLPAMQIGLYTVEITHPEITISEVSPNSYELAPHEDVINPTFVVE